MYCRPETGTGETLRVHWPGGSSFLHKMTSWPPSWKWRQVENPTPSVDAYAREEYFCQIPSRSDLKRRSLRVTRRRTRTRTRTRWVAIWMRSVPDRINVAHFIAESVVGIYVGPRLQCKSNRAVDALLRHWQSDWVVEHARVVGVLTNEVVWRVASNQLISSVAHIQHTRLDTLQYTGLMDSSSLLINRFERRTLWSRAVALLV